MNLLKLWSKHKIILSVLALLPLGLGAFWLGYNHEDTINGVPVVRLHILSTRSYNCVLMVENSSGTRSELDSYGTSCPEIPAQSYATFEVWIGQWNSKTYVYKFVTDDGKQRDEEYRAVGEDLQ